MMVDLEPEVSRFLPVPDFPMKPAEKQFFLSEQAFLAALPRVINLDVISSQDSKQQVFGYLSDLSSTQMAEQTLLSYGLMDGICHSSNNLAKRYGFSNHSIDVNTRVVLQSLWLLHSGDFPRELYNFSGNLAQRYVTEGVQVQGVQRRIFERAQRNIFYYQDRVFILAQEEETLKLLEGLYGKKTRDTFAQFYRVDGYKEAESFERQGNFTFKSGGFQERLALEDVLEVGRATTEYAHDVETGSVKWTSIKGIRTAGYRRKGTHFAGVLQEYQEQVKVAEAIKDPNIMKYLGEYPLELLRLTTESRLSGVSKEKALQQFNAKYSTNYTLNTVLDLERRALREFEENRLVVLDRREKIKQLVKSAPLRGRLARVLADIVYNYHVEGLKNSTLADYINLPVSRWQAIVGLRKFLDIQILESQGYSVYERPKKGEIISKMIDAYFANDDLPPTLIDLLIQIAESRNLPELAAKLFEKWPRTDDALATLRKLAVETVRQSQRLFSLAQDDGKSDMVKRRHRVR